MTEGTWEKQPAGSSPSREAIPGGSLELLGTKDASGSPWLPRTSPEDTLSFWTPSSLERPGKGGAQYHPSGNRKCWKVLQKILCPHPSVLPSRAQIRASQCVGEGGGEKVGGERLWVRRSAGGRWWGKGWRGRRLEGKRLEGEKVGRGKVAGEKVGGGKVVGKGDVGGMAGHRWGWQQSLRELESYLPEPGAAA